MLAPSLDEWIPARGFGAEQKDVLDYSCRNSTFSLGITVFPLYNHASASLSAAFSFLLLSISHFSSFFFFSLTLPSHSDVTGGLQKQGTAWADEPWGEGSWWPQESFPQRPCSKGLIHKGQPQGQPLDLLCHPGRGRRWRNQQLNGWRHKDGSIPPLPSWSTGNSLCQEASAQERRGPPVRFTQIRPRFVFFLPSENWAAYSMTRTYVIKIEVITNNYSRPYDALSSLNGLICTRLVQFSVSASLLSLPPSPQDFYSLAECHTGKLAVRNLPPLFLRRWTSYKQEAVVVSAHPCYPNLTQVWCHQYKGRFF